MQGKKWKKFLGLDLWPLEIYFYFLSVLLIYGSWTGFVLDDQRSNLVTSLLAVVLGTLVCSLTHWILKKLLARTPYGGLLVLVPPLALIYCLYELFQGLAKDGNLGDLEVALWTGGFFLIQWIFIRSLLALVHREKRGGLAFVFGLVLQSLLVVFLAFPGIQSPQRQRVDLEKARVQGQASQEFYYGRPPFKTVNLSPYVSYNGFNKKLRDYYWGFSLSEAPLRGKVYLPKEKRAPVLFLVHGNHNMTTKSELGYDYLGRYLAQRGIATVSVDESFLNGYLGKGVGNENDARAILLLENIQELFQKNKDPKSPFYQAFDEDKLFLAGHSRGGEAVHLAADFTERDHYPDEASRSLNYPLKIKGVMTLSPTSGQYTPAGHSSSLKNIFYLTLQGSHDADVNSFMGDDGYKHVSNTDPKLYKMAIYAGFMDHSGSNDLWKSDKILPKALFYNRKDLLSRSSQKALVAKTLEAFMEDILEGKEDFYTNPEKYLPRNLYWIKKERGGEEVLADFEEDSLIATNSWGGKSQVLGANSYREEALGHMNSGGPDTFHGLNMSFTRTAQYQMDLPDFHLGDGDYLRLDLSNQGGEEVDIQVLLQDQEGRQAYLNPKIQGLEPSLDFALTKFYLFNKKETNKTAFQSLDFSLDQEEVQKTGLDPSRLASIKIMFKTENNGNIILDEVGVGRGQESR